LGLNEDLAEAIAVGHDLGHTPFGHAGEAALSDMLGKPFRHNEQSLRVVDYLEKDGAGLNLTYEVRMGILGHTGAHIPETLEGQIVRRSDQIAYVNHDIDDAIRAGILTDDDIPAAITDILGHTSRDRINTLVCDAIMVSREAGAVVLSPEVETALRDLRSFMFERVYRNPVAKGEESKAKDMLRRMFEYYVNHPEALPEDFQPQLSFDGMERTVCDYIAGMTDNYAVDKFTQIFIPMGWHVRG
jgi:dGTPase